MYVFRSLCTASFLSNCNQNQNVSTKLVKIPNMIFLEYLSRSSTGPCGKIDQSTDMAGLFTICFTDAPKMCHSGGHISDVRRQGICHYHMCKVKIPSFKSLAAYADFSDRASDWSSVIPHSSIFSIVPLAPTKRTMSPKTITHIIFFLNTEQYSVLCHRQFAENSTWYIYFA